MKAFIVYILFLFLLLGFAESISLAQISSLEVYNAEGDVIGTLKIWEAQGTQYVLLEDISKLFSATRKNEPLFGRMTIILNETRIVVTKERNRIKINDDENTISKPALSISGKLAVPLDFITKIVSKVIGKRIILDLDAGTLEITEDQFNSQGIYASTRRAIYRILIDPGHGGYDIGAKSKSGLQEKDLTLKVAQKVKELLGDREGIEVFLTRSEDKYMTLDERVKFANNLRGNVLLSIHFNASPSENSKGFNLCINNERILIGTGVNSVSNQGMFYFQSRRFSNEIRAKLGRIIATGGKNIEAPMSVINGLFMPCVLVEIAYLTNQSDLDILAKTDFIDSVAMAFSDSILAFGRTTIEEATDR
jgi:N-acetylmuramoyl-L-alanine amidase